jgi:hypothetical protein
LRFDSKIELTTFQAANSYIYTIEISSVMTTFELKKLLISRIKEINDTSFLNEIKSLLESKSSEKILVLTSEQKDEINRSKKEIKKGHFTDQSELDKAVAKWANEK